MSKNAIIFAHQDETKRPSPLSEVVFQTMLDCVIKTTKEIDFDKIIVVSNIDVDTLELKLKNKNSVSIVSFNELKENSDLFDEETDYILLDSNIPTVNKRDIDDSYNHFIKSNKKSIKIVNNNNECLYAIVTKSILTSILNDFSINNNLFADVAHREDIENKHISNNDMDIIVNNNLDLFNLNKKIASTIILNHIENGVNFINTDSIIIGSDVKIGKGTLILPGTILKGDTSIGEGCKIGPNSLIENSIFNNNIVFNASQCYNSTIESDVAIGPFCHIRPNSYIKSKVKLGDFVEIKNSTLGEGTHVSHLTYVGDSDVGKNVNFGCGVVTVNYNGTTKNRCVIGDDAFIGCNTNLVAPVKIGYRGYTAAGSTITDEVPDEALAIARARQVNKEGYNTVERIKLKYNK